MQVHTLVILMISNPGDNVYDGDTEDENNNLEINCYWEPRKSDLDMSKTSNRVNFQFLHFLKWKTRFSLTTMSRFLIWQHERFPSAREKVTWNLCTKINDNIGNPVWSGCCCSRILISIMIIHEPLRAFGLLAPGARWSRIRSKRPSTMIRSFERKRTEFLFKKCDGGKSTERTEAFF